MRTCAPGIAAFPATAFHCPWSWPTLSGQHGPRGRRRRRQQAHQYGKPAQSARVPCPEDRPAAVPQGEVIEGERYAQFHVRPNSGAAAASRTAEWSTLPGQVRQNRFCQTWAMSSPAARSASAPLSLRMISSGVCLLRFTSRASFLDQEPSQSTSETLITPGSVLGEGVTTGTRSRSTVTKAACSR